MAEFTTDSTGMTVIRSSPSGPAPGPTTGPGAIQSGSSSPNFGGAVQSGSSSTPYVHSTTPVNATAQQPAPGAVVKRETAQTAAAVVDPSGDGRSNEAPPELVPLNIDYRTQGKIRDLPVNKQLEDVIRTAAVAAGVDEIRIGSGGQPSTGVYGVDRTGSRRHDLGNAADIDLVVKGRVLSFEDAADRAIFEKFISTAVGAGATGVGAATDYMGPNRIHIGFGGSAAWGRGGKTRNAPEWLTAAHQAGIANPVPIDRTGADLAFTKADRLDDPFGVAQSKRQARDPAVPNAATVPIPTDRPNPNAIFNPALAGQGGGQGGAPQGLTAPLTTEIGAAVIDSRQIMDRGWKGPAVQELQQFLAYQGIPVEIDGVYGRETRRAVKSYQMRAQIQVDGRVGPETYQAILHDIDPSVSVMPGEAAYRAGKTSAEKIVSPGRSEVDIRLPKPRPDRTVSRREVDIPLPPDKGRAIPNPRMRPIDVAMRDASTIISPEERTQIIADLEAVRTTLPMRDTLRGTDATETSPSVMFSGRARFVHPSAGSKAGLEAKPGDKPDEPAMDARDYGKFQRSLQRGEVPYAELPDAWRKEIEAKGMTEDAYDRAMASVRKAAARNDAAATASMASAQRLAGTQSGQRDRYRMSPESRELGIAATDIRTAETLREMARGIGDSYREAIDRKITAASVVVDGPTREAARLLEQAALDYDPNAANTMTRVYAFDSPEARSERLMNSMRERYRKQFASGELDYDEEIARIKRGRTEPAF